MSNELDAACTVSTTPGPPTGLQSDPGFEHLTVPLRMYSFCPATATVDMMRFLPRDVSIL